MAAVGAYCAEDAAEPGLALRWLGIGCELGEQELAAAGVVEVGAAVAGRVDAGCAAEGIYLEAGVVGEGDLAAGRGIGAGLELSVGGKGLAAFLDVELKAQRGRRNDLDIGKQGADFAQLAGVVRGQKQRHGGYWGGLSSSASLLAA